MKSKHHFPASGEEQCRHGEVNSILKPDKLTSLSECFFLYNHTKEKGQKNPILLFQFEYYNSSTNQKSDLNKLVNSQILALI